MDGNKDGDAFGSEVESALGFAVGAEGVYVAPSRIDHTMITA